MNEQTEKLARLLLDAGWTHTADAQWGNLEKALPDIVALLAQAPSITAQDIERVISQTEQAIKKAESSLDYVVHVDVAADCLSTIRSLLSSLRAPMDGEDEELIDVLVYEAKRYGGALVATLDVVDKGPLEKAREALARALRATRAGAGEASTPPKPDCEVCRGSGWYGDRGPGRFGNREFAPCECTIPLAPRPLPNGLREALEGLLEGTREDYSDAGMLSEKQRKVNAGWKALASLSPDAPKEETRTITIPALVEHEGFHAITITVPWKCLWCGKRRGDPFKGLSFDGSRRLEVDRWNNPCGHVETYETVRRALATPPPADPKEEGR